MTTVTDASNQILEDVQLSYSIADFDGEIEYGKTYTITISANGNYQGQTSFTFTVNDHLLVWPLTNYEMIWNHKNHSYQKNSTS